jgi:hypothetical protein
MCAAPETLMERQFDDIEIMTQFEKLFLTIRITLHISVSGDILVQAGYQDVFQQI